MAVFQVAILWYYTASYKQYEEEFKVKQHATYSLPTMFCCAFAAIFALSGHAADVSWTGATDADWATTSNWDGGVPQAGDSVTIPSGVANMPILSAPTPALDSITISGTLTFTNWTTCLNATTVTISSGGIVTCAGPFTDADMSNRVWIACTDLTIASGGKIDVSEKGYGSSATGRTPYGPGHGSIKGGGGAHGGYGGYYLAGNGETYGDYAMPMSPGSTGNVHANRSGAKVIGNGGGAVYIDASGTVTLNGAVSANGKIGTDGFGGGSGGSICVSANKISADGGSLNANGGNSGATVAFGHPGGGGRIALRYDANAQIESDLVSLSVSAGPGKKNMSSKIRPWNYGDDRYNADIGTVYFTDAKPLKFLGTSLTGQIYLGSGASYSCESITMTDGWVRFAQEGFVLTVSQDVSISGTGTRLEMGGGTFLGGLSTTFARRVSGTTPWTLSIGGDLSIFGGAWVSGFAASTNGTTTTIGGRIAVSGDLSVSGTASDCMSSLCLACCPTNGAAIDVTAENVIIGEEALVSAKARGFEYNNGIPSGKAYCSGDAKGTNADKYIGAGHGGLGRNGTSAHGATYDDPLRPVLPGSGGHAAYASFDFADSGGGVIHMKANKSMTIAGTVDASAWESIVSTEAYCRFAGASGGSVLLECKTFSFPATGIINAKGTGIKDKDTTFNNGAAGGGGRIAVWTGAPYVEGETKASAITVSEAQPAEWLGTFSAAGGYFTDSVGYGRKFVAAGGVIGVVIEEGVEVDHGEETAESGTWYTCPVSEATVRGGDGTIRFVTVASGSGLMIFVR